MSADWYCQVKNKELGPLTVEQLRDMARSGRLTTADFVRRGESGDWVAATRAKGLFDGPEPPPAARNGSGDGDGQVAEFDGVVPTPDGERLRSISSISECISREESKRRFGVTAMNVLMWGGLLLFVVGTLGAILLFYAVAWVVNWLLSEYNVRKLQAIGTTATEDQFPEIHQALADVCEQFGIEDLPKVIVLNASEVNAFAIKFARKKVIVLLSETLEGILDKPPQLRFIMAHEMAHVVLDHGFRGVFELYKPAPYKAARELTCDNCGCAAAGSVASAKVVLKRLGVGNQLFSRLDEDFLISEADYIYSGITGWFLKQYLTYPPLGRRIANLVDFAESA